MNSQGSAIGDLIYYKAQAIEIANDLCYGDDIKEMIRDASTINQVTHMLSTGRHRMPDKEDKRYVRK